MTTRMKLHSLLGDYPVTAAFKAGTSRSDLVEFDFADVKVAHTEFKPLVREHRYDFGELAIVTFLQAKAYGKPYVLIPATVVGRGQMHTIAYNPERGALAAGDLNGKRLGVRAYTQTTGAWLRGMLADSYGVDLDSLTWVTFEEPHVAEYKDPPFVTRAAAGKTLVQMLLDGELDAAVVGDKLPDPRLKPLIADAEAADAAWAAAHGGVPINHMLVIRDSIAKERPDVVKDIYRLFAASKQAADAVKPPGKFDPRRLGVEANRATLEVIIDYALAQKLIPRRFSVDELFDDTTRALG